MSNKLDYFIKRMQAAQLNQIVIDTFSDYYAKLVKGESGKLSKHEINTPSENNVLSYKNLNNNDTKNLNKLAIIKLNGGLGTSMGLTKAKSLLPVKGELSFLDIIARQVLYLRDKYHCQIPILFMNSFNTQEDTLNSLAKYPELTKNNVSIDFLQNKFPKIRQNDLLPLEAEDDNLNWNPPGHGDLYTCLASGDTIERLIASGIEYLFVANSDNLGATVDLKILNYMVEDKIPFIIEVCRRTEMDKKGGHLAEDKQGHLLLRESAQCPEEELEEFQNIHLYSFFNTNNLWIDLKALKKYLQEHNNVVSLPLIVNPKKVGEVAVFQLETAMGSAINLFKGAKAVCVERDRFVPVKKTQDLLMVWSDIYTLNEDFTIKAENDKRHFIDLDTEHYGSIAEMQKRIPYAPSLKDCEQLVLNGDVHFRQKVSFKGKIKIVTHKRLDLEDIEISG